VKSCEFMTTQAMREDVGGGEEGHRGQIGERSKGQHNVVFNFFKIKKDFYV